MEKEVKVPCITFKGPVTINGPMFDIHDNENVYFGDSEKGKPGRKSKAGDVEKMMLCSESERETIMEVMRYFIEGKGGKESVLTLKAAVSLEWISSVPSHAIAVSCFGCASGSSTYNDYRNGTKTIHSDEIETRKRELQNSLNSRR